jgi:hypothetical protein
VGAARLRRADSELHRSVEDDLKASDLDGDYVSPKARQSVVLSARIVFI